MIRNKKRLHCIWSYGGHASTVPKSIYNIGNEKKYRVIFATLAEFMTLCSKIKARGHKCI